MTDLRATPLYDLHVALGAKMVPFAGYEMPVQYALGVMKEHLHTRAHAGLFDVSHMGQVRLSGRDYAHVAAAFETMVPMNVAELADGRQRYGMFTNDAGGILDDLMFARRGEGILAVVNAACKTQDIARMRDVLAPLGIEIEEIHDRALIALQGPEAEMALARLAPEVADMAFMDVRDVTILGETCWVSRSGYTGEDGYEISVPDHAAVAVTQALLDMDEVEAIGLGARDSLRLEAGLCLYGNDIDTDTTPIEAALTWAIQKRRRSDGGFPGADVIQGQLENGVARKRVGLSPQGRAPMREGTEIYATAEGGAAIGRVTSGGFGPSIGAPVAMGYVAAQYAKTGTELFGAVRGKRLPLVVAALPFVPANFKR